MIRTCRTIFLAMVLASPCWLTGAHAQIDEGNEELAAGNPRAAMIRFETAVRKSPDDIEARFGLAKSLLLLGEFDRAEKMAQVVYRRTGNQDAAIIMAEALYGLEEFSKAEVALANAAEHPDHPALASLISAEKSLQAGDAKGAITVLRDAIDHPRLGVQARLVGARAQYARGDYARAQRLVESILTSDEAALPVLQLRARLALKSGDDTLADQLADQILARAPGHPAATSLLVESALRRGDIARAREALANISVDDARDARPVFLEVLILLQEDRLNEASDTASTIEPWLMTAPGGAVLLSQIKMQNGRTAQAEGILRKRLQHEPSDHTVRQLLIQLYDATDRSDRADAVLNEGLAEAPDDQILRAVLAERQMAQGDFAAAAETMRSIGATDQIGLYAALETEGGGSVSPTLKAISSLLSAQSALQHNDPKTAILLAQDALLAEKTRPLAMKFLAEANIASGQSDEAKALLDELILEQPNYADAIFLRARLDGGEDALMTQLELAVEAGAQSPSIFALLGAEQYVAGEIAASLKSADAAWNASVPLSIHALVRPRIKLSTGDRAGAIKDLNSIWSLREDVSPDVLILAAQIYEDAGAIDRTAEIYSRFADGGRNTEYAIGAAAALTQIGDDKQATELLAMAVRKNPGNGPVAAAYLKKICKVDCAKARRRLATDANMRQFDTPVLRAQLFGAEGRLEDAFEVLSATGSNPAARLAWAQLAESPEDKRRLLTELQTQHANAPSDIGLAVLVSGVAIELGDLDSAEHAISIGLESAPNDPILTNNLAVLRMTSDPELSVALAERAYASRPDLAEIAKTLVDAYTAVGQKQQASRLKRRLQLAGESE